MLKKVIATRKAPGAIGPYSQAIMAGNLIYTSGQLPMDAETGEMVANDIVLQTRKSLQNVKAILEEAGSSMDKIVKTTVYLSDMANFGKMNEIYKEFFSGDYPARSAFQVARLPKDALVEIEVVALV
ncbi:MAG TPA: RidA family protein [Proteiniclasticum sp.]|nr:RidA family protein [Proteiniclasticum sp.]